MLKALFLALTFSLVSSTYVTTTYLSTVATVKQCYPYIQPDSNVNTTWLRSTEVWYAPFYSTSNVGLVNALFLGDPNAPLELFTSQSCLTLQMDRAEVFGFGKKMPGDAKFLYNSNRPGLIEWIHNGKFSANQYIVFTDNKSYAVKVDELPDGSRGFIVLTPGPEVITFSQSQIRVLKDKLVSIGFAEGDLVYADTLCSQRFHEDRKQRCNF